MTGSSRKPHQDPGAGRRRTAAALLTAVLLLCGCGASQTTVDASRDLEMARTHGLKVGITEHGVLGTGLGADRIGMDAELTGGFGKAIGAEIIYVEIDWADRIDLINSGKIDCIWNTMTRTPAMEEQLDLTVDYLKNAQAVVMRKSRAPEYPDLDSCSHLLFAVEGGSVGRTSLEDLHYRVSAFDSQIAALDAVREEKADAAVVDLVFALGLIGNDATYQDLTVTYKMDEEMLCVGFRKGSSLTAEANAYLEQIMEDGTLLRVLTSYGLEDAFPR